MFYVKVRGFDDTEEGEYRLRITLDAPQPANPPESDFYSFTVGDGDELTLWTELPGGGPGEFVNALDPYLRLYDNTGALVVQDDNSGVGTNAQIEHTIGAGEAGTWTVEVAAAGAQGGEYVLLTDQVSGGPIEAARLADGQVILYDTDVADPLLSDVDALDVVITFDANNIVRGVTLVGNPTGFGMLVKPHDNGPVWINDARPQPPSNLADLSFVATSGPASFVKLLSPVRGANFGPKIQMEGVGPGADLDDDGDTTDPTGVFVNGYATEIQVVRGIYADTVVLGDLGEEFWFPHGRKLAWWTRGLWSGADIGGDVFVTGETWRIESIGGLINGANVLVEGNASIIIFHGGGPTAGNVTVLGDLYYFAVQGVSFTGALNAGSLDIGIFANTNGIEGPINITQNDVDGDFVPDTSGSVGRLEVWYGNVNTGAPVSIAGDLGVWMPGWLGGRWRGLWVAGAVNAPVVVGATTWRMDIYGLLNNTITAGGPVDILVFYGGSSAAGDVTAGGPLRYFGTLGAFFDGELNAPSADLVYYATTSGVDGVVNIAGNVRRFEVWYGSVLAPVNIGGDVQDWFYVAAGNLRHDLTVSGTASWIVIVGNVLNASINPLLPGTLVKVQVGGTIQSAGPEVIRSKAGTPSYFISDATFAGTITPAANHIFDGTVDAHIA